MSNLTKTAHMATFSFFQKDRPKKDGTYPILLIAMSGDDKRRITLKFSVPKSAWDKNAQKFTKSIKDHALMNRALRKIQDKCDEIHNQLVSIHMEFQLDEFVRQYKIWSNPATTGTSKVSIANYYDILFNRIKNDEKNPGNAKLYRDTQNDFAKFVKENPKLIIVHFEHLTTKILNQYILWMRRTGTKSNRTMDLRITNLQAAYNKAKKDGLIKDVPNPFKSLDRSQLRKKQEGQKQGYDYLTAEQWEHFKISTPTDPVNRLAHDMFKFSLYCNGINLVDLVKLTWGNLDYENKILSYVRTKTGKKVRVYLRGELIEIIEKYRSSLQTKNYVLPICHMDNPTAQYIFNLKVRKSRDFNRKLKEIAIEFNIDKNLTFYVARHTFATLLYFKDTPIPSISAALGHGTESETVGYLRDLDVLKVHDIIKDKL